MNKNYGERWRKLLAEINVYNARVTASLTMYVGDVLCIGVGVKNGSMLLSPYETKDFPATPKGLIDAHKWVVETKREMAEHISNPAHQRAETVQKQVGGTNVSTAT